MPREDIHSCGDCSLSLFPGLLHYNRPTDVSGRLREQELGRVCDRDPLLLWDKVLPASEYWCSLSHPSDNPDRLILVP